MPRAVREKVTPADVANALWLAGEDVRQAISKAKTLGQSDAVVFGIDTLEAILKAVQDTAKLWREMDRDRKAAG